MKMIRHQAKRLHRPAGFAARFAQGADELLPIVVIPKNWFASAPTIHDVVHRPGVFNSEFARQTAPGTQICQYQELTRLWIAEGGGAFCQTLPDILPVRA